MLEDKQASVAEVLGKRRTATTDGQDAKRRSMGHNGLRSSNYVEAAGTIARLEHNCEEAEHKAEQLTTPVPDKKKQQPKITPTASPV
jgi:hypothetical protein